MHTELNQWIDTLKAQVLPAMALTMQRVPQLLDSPNTTNADFQRIISRDPGFTLAVFRAFEKQPTSPKEPPANLMHAIALLGTAPVSQISKSLPVLRATVSGRARKELYDCYSRAGHAAWYAYSLGRHRRDPNPEEMEVAALLHELGEMMLWAHSKAEMRKLCHLERRGLSRDKAAIEILGCTLDQISAALAEEWRLPQLTRDALQTFGAFQTRSLGVMICDSLARESAKSWSSPQTLELIEIAAEYQQRDLDETRAVIHSITAKAARDLSGLPLPLAAYELIQLKGDSSKPSQQLEQPAANQHKEQPKHPPAIPSETKQNPQQLAIRRCFKALREDLKLERILFAMLTPDQKQIKAKYMVGVNKDTALAGFHFQLGQKHLFNVLMKKPQGFWLNADNRNKYLPLIPVDLIGTPPTQGFFAMSLFVEGRPLGLLYADKTTAEHLTRTEFDQFKVLGFRLAKQSGQRLIEKRKPKGQQPAR